MEDRLIAVYALDDKTGTDLLAVIYPSGRVGATDDLELLRRVRAALTDPTASISIPPDYRAVRGPASDHEPASEDWVIAVCVGLVYQGLRGEPVGFGPVGPGEPDVYPLKY